MDIQTYGPVYTQDIFGNIQAQRNIVIGNKFFWASKATEDSLIIISYQGKFVSALVGDIKDTKKIIKVIMNSLINSFLKK